MKYNKGKIVPSYNYLLVIAIVSNQSRIKDIWKLIEIQQGSNLGVKVQLPQAPVNSTSNTYADLLLLLFFN